MANTLLIKRGTSANLLTLAAGNGIKVGELYFLTDTKILAVGLTTNTFVSYNTDSVPEGTLNVYFTNSRVLNTVLAGLSLVTNAAVTAADSVLVAIGKLQTQFTNHFGSGGTAHALATTLVAGFMSSSDKVKLDGLGAGATLPGGNTKEVQFNNAGVMAGAANVEIDNGDIVLLNNNAPVTPPTGAVKLFGKTIASRVMVASVGPSGLDAILQPALFRQKIGYWASVGNTIALTVIGFPPVINLGTLSGRAVATTNLQTRTRRLGIFSATTVGAVGGNYTTVAQFTTGNGAGLGGFFYSCCFAFADPANMATARAFVGLSSAVTAPTNVEPSTLTNSFGIAQLSTDSTQLFLVYGGSTAQTAIALGTNFPPMAGVGATNGIVYNLTLFSNPNVNGVVSYRVERLGTNFVTEGNFPLITPGVQLPGSTVLIGHRAWRSNNDIALATAIELMSIYFETDY